MRAHIPWVVESPSFSQLVSQSVGGSGTKATKTECVRKEEKNVQIDLLETAICVPNKQKNNQHGGQW